MVAVWRRRFRLPERGARVISAPRGRGRQFAADIAASSAPFLLLLHADTRLALGWAGPVGALIDAERAPAHHGRLRLDGADPRARIIEALAGLRCAVFRPALWRSGAADPSRAARRGGQDARFAADGGCGTRRPAGSSQSRADRGDRDRRCRCLSARWLVLSGVVESMAARPFFSRCRDGWPCRALSAMNRPVLIVFARAPRLGQAKPRLAGEIGEGVALRLYRANLPLLLRRLVRLRGWA